MKTKEPLAGGLGRAVRLAGLTAGVTGSYLGYMFQRIFLDKPRGEQKRRSTHAKAGRRIRDELQVLRGPIMKIGQALSMYTDGVPDEVLAELTKLQMEAPGMHPTLARAQFKASLGRSPDEVFTDFDDRPFAAASLGQVHHATLRDGTRVAVKLQYPGIRVAIENDFRMIRNMTLPAQVSGHVPKAAIDEMESQIIAETDYIRESDHIEFFKDRLAPLGYIDVPDVYRQYSTDRVLTMSVMRGQHIDAFLTKRPSQKLRDLIGSRLLESFFFQVLQLHTIHADPHWGNYLFNEDGTIGLVDFGCVKRLGTDVVAGLRKSFLYPGSYESSEFQQIIQEQFAGPGQTLSRAKRRAIVGLSEAFYKKVYPPDPKLADHAFDFSVDTIVGDFVRTASGMTRARLTPPQFLFLGRTEIGLYMTLHRLRARVATSHILRRLLNVGNEV